MTGKGPARGSQMSSAAFKQLWLDTDTFIGPLSPTQIQQLRALCEKFYEAGRRHERKAAAAAPQ